MNRVIYSDSQFLKDSLEETDVQEEKSVLVTDGGYSGGDNTDLAAKKNIQLITTALTGKEARMSWQILNLRRTTRN